MMLKPGWTSQQRSDVVRQEGESMHARTSVLVVAAALGGSSIALARTGYYQFPDLHEHMVVFASEGDLWTVADTGGVARRVTTHAGSEYFPRYSPDGKSIAFTGEYGGNRDVYVIPADGGEPRRLTWHPDPDEVIDWMPDGKRIIFRSRAGNDTTSGFEWHLFTVAVDGGDPEPLPLGFAGRVAIDPATRRWAFNRSSVEFRTWKRYRGGTAPTIWVGDPDKHDFKEIAKTQGAEAFPMWSNGRLFYLSDQGGTANLWSMRADGAEAKRETRETTWDVRWPAVAPDGRIAFSLAGDLHIYNPATGKDGKLEIDIPSERKLGRVRYPSAEKNATSFDLAPDGDRLAVVTRGEIMSVAVKDGVTLPITRGSAARERGAAFSSDGKSLIYITDAPGEEELRAIDAWGRGQPRVLVPAGKTGWHFPPVASPDGKWIAYADQTQTLYVIPAAGGAPRTVDHSAQSEINEYAFSPDGRYLAYSLSLATDYSIIRVFDTQTGKSVSITGAATNDFTPAWDPEGRYLYFLSDRAANPVPDVRQHQRHAARPGRRQAQGRRQEARRQEGQAAAQAGQDRPRRPGRSLRGVPGATGQLRRARRDRQDGVLHRDPRARHDRGDGRRRRTAGGDAGRVRPREAQGQAVPRRRHPVQARRRQARGRQEDRRVRRRRRQAAVPRGARRAEGRAVEHGRRALAAGRVAADLRRDLADDARLLLGPQHGRRRLEGPA
ncbi:MAG: hypothetical protein E6J91_02445 [Deltaproteobacteria bacterium]|nr:MAG: hypothetical protein E6J91_02445 [Deltaproteobacteria bacterium]